MRAFVVIVSLFIGLTSGFIVPSGVLEDDREKPTVNNLENNIKNKIDEGEIYQNTGNKSTNVNERSYIFIKQKFHIPFRNQPHRALSDQHRSLYFNSQKPERYRPIQFFSPDNANIVQSDLYKYNKHKYTDTDTQKQYQNISSEKKSEMKPVKQMKPEIGEMIPQKIIAQPLNDADKKVQKFYQKYANDASNLGTNINKMRITSYINRKSSNFKYSFPKPYLLHRSSFSSKHDSVKSPTTNSYGDFEKDKTHKSLLTEDINLSDMKNDVEKIETYIKDTLEDIGLQENDEIATNNFDYNLNKKSVSKTGDKNMDSKENETKDIHAIAENYFEAKKQNWDNKQR